MKKLMLAAAAAALIIPTGAAAGDKNKSKMKTETSAGINTGDTVYLEPASVSAKDLLGEGVTGVNGERIARVDDIVIGADGKAESLVFLSGGVFGLGGKRGALDYSRVSLAIDGDRDPRVSISMTEEGIQSVAEYKTEEMNDYSLASELIGASVDLLNSDEDAVINDLILAQDGSVSHAIIQDGMIPGFSDKYAVTFDKIAVEQGAGGLVLDMTPEALKASPRFEYRHALKWNDDVSVEVKTDSDQ